MYKYIYMCVCVCVFILIRVSPSLYQEDGDELIPKNSYCTKAVSVTQKHTRAHLSNRS